MNTAENLISAGHDHTIIVGKKWLYTCGKNDCGQLGIESNKDTEI